MLSRFLPGLALAVAFTPATLVAQAPGYQQIDTRQIMAAYHAEVLMGVNRVMDRWGTAWREDEVDRVVDLYWDNASLIPPEGPPVRGEAALRAYLEDVLPKQGGMEAFMLDFDASGGMALVSGNYSVEVDGAPRRGALTTVFLQRGRTWKIRSQIFTPSGP